jgi:sulfite reductase alpha subunit-like flavoprotein
MPSACRRRGPSWGSPPPTRDIRPTTPDASSWVEGLGSDALEGVRYCVFGCGNRQWARTYQVIPKRMDAALEKAGATRIKDLGETDAGGDFFGGFEKWYADLWTTFGKTFGKETVEPAASELDVEIVRSGREMALRLTHLDRGRVIENRELVDMTWPSARSKRHIEIALPRGMSYRTGDYLAVLPRNPRQDVERALRRFGLAADTQIVIHRGVGNATACRASTRSRSPISWQTNTGSGIAPFHGFLQGRAIQKAGGREVGPALLFFGVDHPEVDYLYKDELDAWQQQGVVEVHPAFPATARAWRRRCRRRSCGSTRTPSE